VVERLYLWHLSASTAIEATVGTPNGDAAQVAIEKGRQPSNSAAQQF